jgi:hypothetical protein
VKTSAFFFVLIIFAGILVTGCVLKPTENKTIEQPSPPTTIPTITVTPTLFVPTPAPVLGNVPAGLPFGQLNISIGNYNAKLPVYVDNMSAGQVMGGKVFTLKVGEGIHSVKVCAGALCELVSTEIKSGVKTSLDFEERLKRDAPQGSLTVSIGSYQGSLPVFIDNSSVGVASQNQPLTQILSPGPHDVKICVEKSCFYQTVTVQPANQTTVSFEDRLRNDISQGSLSISIGGFNAVDLPVQVDNINVGTVSQGKNLNLMLKEGNHTVKVCAGTVCEKQEIIIQFAKQSTVDFGDQLKADVEFPTPTAKITKTVLSGPSLTVEVEFINPDKVDHIMSVTVSCVYSYTDSQNFRRNDAAQSRISSTVKAGDRTTQQVSLYLGGGSNVIANNPVLVDVTIK